MNQPTQCHNVLVLHRSIKNIKKKRYFVEHCHSQKNYVIGLHLCTLTLILSPNVKVEPLFIMIFTTYRPTVMTTALKEITSQTDAGPHSEVGWAPDS